MRFVRRLWSGLVVAASVALVPGCGGGGSANDEAGFEGSGDGSVGSVGTGSEDTGDGDIGVAPPRPNVIVIIADDQPAYLLGAAGSTIRTPRLDQLAAEGVYLRRMYLSTGICGPSRASLITGRMPFATGVLINGDPLDLEQPILPRLLHDDGYTTGFVGKCHLDEDPYYEDPEGGGSPIPINPDPFTETLGFDHRLVMYPDKGYIVNHYAYEVVRNGVPEAVSGTDNYISDFLNRESMDFIEDHAADADPFFLWVGHIAPHEPLSNGNRPPEFNPERGGSPGYEHAEVPKPQNELTEDLTTKPQQLTDARPHQAYLGSSAGSRDTIRRNMWEVTENLDTNVGRLVDKLEDLGIADDTVVIYLSDNGQMVGEHQMMKKGPSFYEEQILTPFILRYPRMPGQGRTLDVLTSSIDMAPTILELAEVPIPQDMHGASLVGLLDGSRDYHYDSIFMSYHGWRENIFPMRGVVSGSFKLVHFLEVSTYHDFGFELYDLSKDPLELDNLASPAAAGVAPGENPLPNLLADPELGPVVTKLRRNMAAWQTRTEDFEGVHITAVDAEPTGPDTIRVTTTTDQSTTLEVEVRVARCDSCEWEETADFALQTDSELEISGLMPDTSYELRIFTINGVGHGALSTAIVSTDP